MKILVVDDSRTMRRIIRRALEGMGYGPENISEACDGRDALSKLNPGGVDADIVLADWNMPNMDGMELLSALRGSARHQHLPVIMVTGEAQRERVAEAIQAGARNYIVKPFTPETLRRKVLAIEMELLAGRNPSESSVLRLDRVKAATESANSDLPFMAQLPEELAAGVHESAEVSEHDAGEVLLEADDVADCLYVIDAGEVTLAVDGATQKRGPGNCFGEVSFLSGDPTGVKVMAGDGVRIASIARDCFDNLLTAYPHLSFYLTKLLARQAKDSLAGAADPDGGLTGRLETMTIAELVQTLHSNKKTGVLTVTSGEEKGEIYFEQGNIRHAETGEAASEEAFYRLVAWSDGAFVFKAGTRQHEIDIHKGTMGLLMEGMRLQDELRLMRA